LSPEKNHMNRKLLLPLLLVLVCLGSACKKSPDQPPPIICYGPGLAGSDADGVKIIITSFIKNLPSQQYTADNLDKLAKDISDKCDVIAKVPCFNCIKTFPSMTELIISFPNSTLQKAVDISYTASNEMKVVNVH